jgi:hypothetical protein
LANSYTQVAIDGANQPRNFVCTSFPGLVGGAHGDLFHERFSALVRISNAFSGDVLAEVFLALTLWGCAATEHRRNYANTCDLSDGRAGAPDGVAEFGPGHFEWPRGDFNAGILNGLAEFGPRSAHVGHALRGALFSMGAQKKLSQSIELKLNRLSFFLCPQTPD